MKKTQKTFKKKYVVYGMMAFAGVALVSTGFATWVLANDASASGSGNVTVGAVAEGGLSITLNNKDKLGSFSFEPKDSDKTGRVRYDGSNAENLSIAFTGKVENCQYLKDVSVRMAVSDGVWEAAGYTKVTTVEEGAIAAPNADNTATQYWKADDSASKYIILPACVTGEVKLTELTTTAGTDPITATDNGINKKGTDKDDTRNFQYTVAFKWGKAFNEKNPGEFYDSDGEGDGKGISYDDVNKTLTAFHDLVGDSTESTESTKSTYNVTFYAHNN